MQCMTLSSFFIYKCDSSPPAKPRLYKHPVSNKLESSTTEFYYVLFCHGYKL